MLDANRRPAPIGAVRISLVLFMQSLYGRLFKYRERPLRSPKEDFLTEALAGFMNLLLKEGNSDFLRRVFVPRSLMTHWAALASRTSQFHVDTQCWIDESSRVDLIVYADREPIIVIENKISAKNQINQLLRYGNWLKKNCTQDWPGVLCFLTHTTAAPVDFTENAANKYGVQPHIVKWADVASHLRELRAEPDPAKFAPRLAEELLTFLSEENMTGEFADFEDFCAAFVYTRSSSKVFHSFSTIFEHIKNYEGFFGGDYKDDEALWQDSSMNFVWGWKFLRTPSFNDLYFGYGISLKPSMHLKGNGVPLTDSVFLCLGSDTDKSFRKIEKGVADLKLGWCIATGDDAVGTWGFRPLSGFLASPEQFPAKMTEWIDETKPDIDRLVNKISEL